jgi:hypothetical protein
VGRIVQGSGPDHAHEDKLDRPVNRGILCRVPRRRHGDRHEESSLSYLPSGTHTTMSSVVTMKSWRLVVRFKAVYTAFPPLPVLAHEDSEPSELSIPARSVQQKMNDLAEQLRSRALPFVLTAAIGEQLLCVRDKDRLQVRDVIG